MHPKHLQIKDFTYDLPEEAVAKFPVTERDQSKLLVYKNGIISTGVYRNLHEHLLADSLLVFNNTKVVEARLIFKKISGAVIEVFCLEPADELGDITSAMLSMGSVRWKCLIGGASKWKHGLILEKKLALNGEIVHLTASISERLSDCFVIEFNWTPVNLPFAEVLHVAGEIPLPPYLHRQAEEQDKETYQTVYAKTDGSVAAPTAGLHFTQKIFQKLEEKRIDTEFVTLHVGAGTFKPVKAEKLAEHEMHAEFIDVTLSTIQNLLRHLDSSIVAVGTTSLRTIESLYWIGLKLLQQRGPDLEGIAVHQWDPYEMDHENVTAHEALSCLLRWMSNNNKTRIVTKTQILIAPGYKLKIANAIITNFHQPQSTLLLLIAAIVGDDWKRIYQYALENDYRFLSYGDGSLLWPKN